MEKNVVKRDYCPVVAENVALSKFCLLFSVEGNGMSKEIRQVLGSSHKK